MNCQCNDSFKRLRRVIVCAQRELFIGMPSITTTPNFCVGHYDSFQVVRLRRVNTRVIMMCTCMFYYLDMFKCLCVRCHGKGSVLEFPI